MRKNDLKAFLDEKVDLYNNRSFIDEDPIVIPHSFSKKQDIEISGLVAAVLAWGQRKTIINKSRQFFNLMDNDPHSFVLHHSESDLKPFLNFKHRTFNEIDALYFIEWFKWFYKGHSSLEDAFFSGLGSRSVKKYLINFYDLFFSLEDYPTRTRKHIQTPVRKSACKRMNMFLRWMVRKDQSGVDFGIWDKIDPSELICPCDLHVDRVARKLGLISRKQTDWETAMELTEALKAFDPDDPVKYDYALFGLGIIEKY